MTGERLPLTRRTLLGGTTAGLAGVGLEAVVADAHAEVAERSLHGPLPRHVDTVVVGAGLAGLVAAREVHRSGRSVLLLEARDRVGGRVLNHPLTGAPPGLHTGPQVIESGGAFIGPTQDRIAALATELGVPTFDEYVTGKSVYVSSTLGRLEYDGTVPPDPTILSDAAVLLNMIDSYAAEIDVAAPWAHPRAADWDAMTLGQWIRAHAVNPAGTERLIACWSQPGFGADPDELSFLFTLWYVACSGDEQNKGTFERNSDTADGAQQKRLVGGSQLVPLRLAQQLGRVLALDAPVRRIVQNHHGAHVHTRRGTVRARRVIVAAPPPLVLGIHFEPALPVQRAALLQHLTMGRLMKCDAIYDRPFWRDAGLNGFGINDSGAARAVFDNTPPSGSPGVLLAFVGGTTWRTYGPAPADQRRTAVLEGFAAMFGDQARHPVDFVEHDWTQERWTGGGPTAILAPGALVPLGPAVRRPHKWVHWAGTETATYWSGYMDGAVSSGLRAAAEVLGGRKPMREHPHHHNHHGHHR